MQKPIVLVASSHGAKDITENTMAIWLKDAFNLIEGFFCLMTSFSLGFIYIRKLNFDRLLVLSRSSSSFNGPEPHRDFSASPVS